MSDLLSSAGIEIDFPRGTQFAEWQLPITRLGVVFNTAQHWAHPIPYGS